VEPHPQNSTVAINDRISVKAGYLIVRESSISLHTITAIKFGWLPIRLDMFRVGDRYVLELKNQDQKCSINLRSYFGIGHDRQHERFNLLLNKIWDNTVTRLFNEMKIKLTAGESVKVGKCFISGAGISYKKFLITWEDLLYQKNYNRLTLNSKSNPSIWTNLYYTETYNVHVLIEYLEWKFGLNSDG
jgi:hypothetical protein